MIGSPKKQALIHKWIELILKIGHIQLKLHNTKECKTHNEHLEVFENMLNSSKDLHNKEDVTKVRS